MRRIALLLCLILCTATFLVADEFVIRQANELTLTEFSFQTAAGDWLVFFTDHSTLSGSIYCHKLSAAGELLTNEAILLSYKETDQTLLDVIPTNDGNFIVIWKEFAASGYTYMQKLTPDCESLWDSDGVRLASSTHSDKSCRVLANDIGGVTVVYQDYWSNPIYGQNYDSSGSKTWGEAGLALVDLDDMVEMKNVSSYPGGGFLVHINIIAETSYKVLRFSGTGMLVDDDFMPAFNLFERRLADIIGPVNGEYLLYTVDVDTLRINKAGANGEAVLAQNLVCFLQHKSFNEIRLLSDGRVAYVLTDGYPVTYTLNMVSPDLELLWSAAEQYPSDGKMLVNECPDGKILLTVEPYAQFFDTTGAKLFAQSRAVTDELYLHPKAMRVLPTGDRGIFLWRDIRNRLQMIKLQILHTDGTLAHAPAGMVLEDRLAGVCDGGLSRGKHQCFSLGNRFLSIWLEKRTEASSIDEYSFLKSGIYYQLFDQNMQPLLEPDGRPLQPLGDNALSMVQCVVSDDNKLYILFNDLGVNTVILQAIDYQGNLCFGDSGLQFVNKNLMMGCVGNVVYLFWTEPSVSNPYKIMGQKYLNGQAQWGQHGELLLASVPNHQYTLLGFENGFLIYSDHYSPYSGESSTHLKALLFDSYGQIVGVGGQNSIFLSSEDVSQTNTLVGTGTMGEDLCIIFRLANPETSRDYIMQKIGTWGNRLWGESGISFVMESEISNILVKDDALTFLTQSGAGYNIHSADMEGNFQTPEGGINIIPAAYEPRQLSLASFDDGSMICAFVFYKGFDSDVYYRRMEADGTPTDSAPVVLCDARNAQTQPRIATYSNTAFVTWMDQRAARDIVGLWGNTVQSSTPVDDALQTPIQQAQIIGNYPNPFNPSTTISYHIATEGMAKLEVYNIKGQLVKTLVKEHKARGKHQAVWDGKDFRGKGVASGVFFVRLSSAGKSSVHKMVLMK